MEVFGVPKGEMEGKMEVSVLEFLSLKNRVLEVLLESCLESKSELI